MNIHELIKDRTELAKIYAEDGAFLSAARVLRSLAESIEKHAHATRPKKSITNEFAPSLGDMKKAEEP